MTTRIKPMQRNDKALNKQTISYIDQCIKYTSIQNWVYEIKDLHLSVDQVWDVTQEMVWEWVNQRFVLHPLLRGLLYESLMKLAENQSLESALKYFIRKYCETLWKKVKTQSLLKKMWWNRLWVEWTSEKMWTKNPWAYDVIALFAPRSALMQ